jgi:hypothetical protein
MTLSEANPRGSERSGEADRDGDRFAIEPWSPLRGIFTSRSLCERVRRRRTGENGANRIRTGDPLLAKQVLYQLSYGPSEIGALGSATGDQRKNLPDH